jgi:hypothetical protein
MYSTKNEHLDLQTKKRKMSGDGSKTAPKKRSWGGEECKIAPFFALWPHLVVASKKKSCQLPMLIRGWVLFLKGFRTVQNQPHYFAIFKSILETSH